MRLSRPCYDKFHRCPGWSGGGPTYARVTRCPGGRIEVNYDDPWWKWKFWPCGNCDVRVLPYHSRALSIPHLIYRAGWWYRNWRYERNGG